MGTEAVDRHDRAESGPAPAHPRLARSTAAVRAEAHAERAATSLAVGAADDPAEREADAVADLVIRSLTTGPGPQPPAQPGPTRIQRFAPGPGPGPLVVRRRLTWTAKDLNQIGGKTGLEQVSAALTLYSATPGGPTLKALVDACEQRQKTCKNVTGRAYSAVEALLDDARKELARFPAPGVLPPTSLATLTVKVDDASLDEGSLLLKKLRATRPAVVNNGGPDKLSNCAIATIAAITGSATSGQATEGVRASLGLGKESKVQSEKLWTIASLDAQVLQSKGLLSVPDAKADEQGARDLDNLPQARMYVLGSLQYFRMLEYLQHLATQESTGAKSFTVHQHGLPGGTMYDEASLVGTMGAYPNGTRFAVFLFSDDPSQHVRQHWVYAEKFDDKVLFQDFQTNTGTAKTPTPADAYLAKFPFSPDKKNDPGKGFSSGAFVAFAPASPSIPDPEVDPSEVDNEIKEAEGYATAWLAKLRAPKQLASTWGALPGDTRLDSIPAPRTVKQGYTTLLTKLGVSSTSTFDIEAPGVVSIVGHPHLKTVGKEQKIETDNLNPTTKVKEPGQAPVLDPTKLSPGAPAPLKFSEAATDSQYTGFSGAYNVMAQNTTKGIQINAERAAFTDLIHEAAHAYEKGSLPAHLREGCAEVFASMVGTAIVQDTGDAAFEHDYNPTYSHFLVATEQVIDLIGLPAMAHVYFESTTPAADLKAKVLERAAPSSDQVAMAKAADDLLKVDGEGHWHPEPFKAGLAALQGKTTAAPAPTFAEEGAVTGLYEPRQAKFGEVLEKHRAALEADKLVAKGADPMTLALAWNDKYGKDVLEKRLRLLYVQATEVGGEAFTEAMQLISMHEVGIGQVTGEDVEAVRLRIKGTKTP